MPHELEARRPDTKAWDGLGREDIMTYVGEVHAPRILTPTSCKEFSKYYPEGQLVNVPSQEINPQAMKRFEGYSRRFILPERYRHGDFHQFFIVEKDDGEQTHVAHQTRDYECSRDRVVERLIYLHEVSFEGEEVGHGEIRFSLSSNDAFMSEGPFENFTETVESLQGMGRGTDRLLVMNGLTQVLFGEPLRSNRFKQRALEEYGGLAEADEKPWLRLEEKRLVRRYSFDGGYRFVFPRS